MDIFLHLDDALCGVKYGNVRQSLPFIICASLLTTLDCALIKVKIALKEIDKISC